ncbi:MAG: aminodeoxychorismate synthase, component I [Omnitrophica WOR_2 bacterium RIFCSPHIGHO2_01_FULL_48_9]|nr:MAG: aminodeoxychorismate synthase, component I [Omnitrophica WOR_2 bacterium RIFCSPHIGHO2_02_FULL_48_11]OGX30213.1 MAG: aminodeoxychorismate synthase, component I [Omnitrophica WOR_2 bacterium RIFCSPHIGHO2_01_FULL_48_9]
MSAHTVKSFVFKGDSLGVFELFKNEPHAFFLDSSLHHPQLGRYSFIGFDPFLVMPGHGPHDLTALRKQFYRYREKERSPYSPFPGGLVGYWSYDLGLALEKIQRQAKADVVLPDFVFGFYDTVITIDHLKNKLHVISTGHPEKKGSLRTKRAKQRSAEICQRLAAQEFDFKKHPALAKKNSAAHALDLQSNFTQREYRSAVKHALHYIREGDIYQVNLAQRFVFDPSPRRFHPTEIYKSLRRQSPSSFTSYLDCGNFQIISSSPERFLQLKGRSVETRPMKGTRPRGDNVRTDERQRRELLASPKDKAELLMITDLERNDLGRVCEYGSVRVKTMREIEKYRTVFQATSTVQGILRKDKDAFDLLQACFPGGSITGCPKIRAMQVIEELEPQHRGIYTGALGYLSFAGDMDLNILIRTMLAYRNKIYFHVGSGIVADSVPQAEYAETLVKAKALRDCLGEMFVSGRE